MPSWAETNWNWKLNSCKGLSDKVLEQQQCGIGTFSVLQNIKRCSNSLKRV